MIFRPDYLLDVGIECKAVYGMYANISTRRNKIRVFTANYNEKILNYLALYYMI